MPISQSDIDRIAEAVALRLVKQEPVNQGSPGLLTPESVASPAQGDPSAKKTNASAYQFFLMCVVGDMADARGMISQAIADKVVAETDPKRTVLFSGKVLSELDSKAWRALAVLSWKHIDAEARSKLTLAQAKPSQELVSE
jgi:hypothetical protein